ncbi:hypothetical protein [Oligoflexus tunisiensis]|uniref:hypothetical protein n=1 Tax=Oligoflexus tunisiensis TaxID=708132 RepID=UPI00114D1A08|nr:hypothetical protein [Oligoflexus tunisiensis]
MRKFHSIMIMLLILPLWSCGPADHSLVKDSSGFIRDYDEGAIKRISIRPSSTKDPNVCVIKEDGQVSCFTQDKKFSLVPSILALAPLRDMDENCLITHEGRLVCALKDSNDRNFHLAEESPQRRVLVAGQQVCVISLKQNADIAQCFAEGASNLNKFRVLGENPAFKDNGAGVVHIAHAELDSKRILLCGLSSGQTIGCDVIGADNVPFKVKPFQTLPGQGYLNFAVNQTSICAVKDSGELACYAVGSQTPLSLPSAINRQDVVEVTGQHNTMCARYQNGDFTCWSGAAVYNRRRFGTVQPVLKVEANQWGICAYFKDERLRCLEPRSGSLVSYEELKAQHLVSANGQTCSFTNSGKVTCWGDTPHYTLPQSKPFPTGNELALGAAHLCHVDNGKVLCQGKNDRNQLQVPTTMGPVVSVKAAKDHSCALDKDGKVACWGDSSALQTQVPSDLDKAKKIFTSPHLSCAILANDSLRCWGRQDLVNSQPPPETSFLDLALGENHACGINSEERLVCWGDNSYGQTVPPAALTPIVSVAAGAHHTCSISEDDLVQCWGRNDATQTSVPTRHLFGKKLALGDRHSCAVDAMTQQVACWGDRQASQIARNLELQNGATAQDYFADLARHHPFGKNPAKCQANAALCEFPTEPVVSFRGFSYTNGIGTEKYSLWYDYTVPKTCDVNKLHFVLNGHILRKARRPKANETYVSDRFELYISTPPSGNASDDGGQLFGPAFLQLRYLSDAGKLQTQVPKACDIRIKRVMYVPTGATISQWHALANGMVEQLQVGLDHLARFKKYENDSNTFYATGISLYEVSIDKYIESVVELLRATDKDGSRVEGFDYSVLDWAEGDYYRPLLADPQTLRIFESPDNSVTHETYVIRPFDDQPEWYKALLSQDDFRAELQILNLNINYVLSLKSLLESRETAAGSKAEIHRARDIVAKGILYTALDRVNRFLDAMSALSNSLDEGFRANLDRAINDIKDQSQYRSSQRETRSAGDQP